MIKRINKYFYGKKKIIFFLISIILLTQIFGTYKKARTISNFNYDKRLADAYDYCNNESLGFLSFLKKKYKNMDNIEIRTAFISPNPQWFFKDYSKKQYSKNRVIILGHKKNKYILFNKEENNIFTSKEGYKTIKNVKKISFEFKSSAITKKIIVNLSSVMQDQLKLISKQNIEVFEGFNEVILKDIDKNNIFMNGTVRIEFDKILSKDQFKIDNVKLHQSDSINLDKYKILEEKQSCLLLEAK